MTAPALTSLVAVDWDKDGSFATAGDDVTARVRLDAGGLWVERGRNQLEPGSPPVASEMGFAIRNESKDYNPLNASSPLYGKTRGKKPVRWAETYSAVTYEIGRTLLKRLHPRSERGLRVADVHGLGQLASLVGVYGLSSALQTDIYTGDAMTLLFAAAGLTDVDFDTGKTLLRYWRIRPDVEAIVQAVQLWAAEGEGAELFDAADGTTIFYDRHRKLTAVRSTVVQATFRDVGTEPTYGGPPQFPEFDYDDGDAHVVNACSIDWKQRAVDAVDAEIWTLGSTVTLSANEARDYPVSPNVEDAPIASVQTPTTGAGDYALVSGAVASIAFDRTSGDFVTMTITAGAGGAQLTGLRVRGKLARVVAQSKIHESIDTSASQDEYGYQPFTFPTIPEIDYLTALDFCNAKVSQNLNARPTTVVTVPLTNDAQAAATLPLEIADRVRIVNAAASFDQSMYAEWLRWERPADHAVARVQIGCKTVYDAPYALWGSGQWGVSVWAF